MKEKMDLLRISNCGPEEYHNKEEKKGVCDVLYRTGHNGCCS